MWSPNASTPFPWFLLLAPSEYLCRGSKRRCLPIARRHQSNREGPGNGQIGIVECDRDILCGVVGAVDAIGHIGRLRERLKPVRTACRDVQRNLGVALKMEALPVAASGRRGSQVDDDVEDRTVRAADQLCLPIAAPYMETTHHPTRRTRDAVLGETCRIDAGRAHHHRVRSTAEEAAFVHVRRGHEQHRTGNARNVLDVHDRRPLWKQATGSTRTVTRQDPPRRQQPHLQRVGHSCAAAARTARSRTLCR